MKSLKVFLLLMLALYVGLFVFDYLKAVVFPVKHHSLVIWLKTFFLVAGGVAIMKITLEYRIFKTFITIYVVLWVFYYVLKWASKFPDQPLERYFQANKLMLFYLNITQLLTPFPFFFFWVLNRVFNSDLLKEMTTKSADKS